MTREEFGRIIDYSNFMIDSNNPYDMKILEALEKQVPKKPLEVASPVLKWGLCPACHGELNKLANQPNRVFAFHRFCPDCGQTLLWEDTE